MELTGMTFDEKVDRAAKLFKLSKKINFINPKYGLYACAICTALFLSGFNLIAELLAGASCVIATMGIVLLQISHRIWRKGHAFLDDSVGDISTDTKPEEAKRRLAKHVATLNESF